MRDPQSKIEDVRELVKQIDSELEHEMQQNAEYHKREQKKDNTLSTENLHRHGRRVGKPSEGDEWPKKLVIVPNWGSIQSAMRIIQLEISTCMQIVVNTKSRESDKVAAVSSSLETVKSLALEAQAKLGK